MTLRDLVSIAVVLFPVSEVVLAVVKRTRSRVVKRADDGSLGVVWLVITLSMTLAMFLAGPARMAPLALAPTLRDALALLALVGGLSLRWLSILSLGRFFAVDVKIHEGHSVVDTGPYRLVRHPSCTGLLIAFLGVGLYLGDGASILALVVPITLALLHRIRIEERALLLALGPAFEAYCAKTRRLIPGIY